MLSCPPPDGLRNDEPLLAVIVAARGWRVSRHERPWPRVAARPRARAIAATARSAIRYRESDGCVAAGAVPSGRGLPSGAAELPVVPSISKRGTHWSRELGCLACSHKIMVW